MEYCIAAIIVLTAVAAYLFARNRELVGNMQKLQALMRNRPAAPAQPMPQAADMIGMDRFHVATDRLDGVIRQMHQQMAKEREESRRQSIDAQIRIQQLEADLKAAAQERVDLIRQHADADRERERLELTNQHLAKELRTTVN